MFYLPKGLLVSLERSISLVCGNAFLTKIPWCITSQWLLKVGSRQTRYGEKLCVFGDFVIFGHFIYGINGISKCFIYVWIAKIYFSTALVKSRKECVNILLTLALV